MAASRIENELSTEEFNTISVRDLALRDPRFRLALEKAGIDCCCDGGKKLKDAAREAGAPQDELRRILHEAAEQPVIPGGSDNWKCDSLARFIEYFMNFHHKPLYEKFSRIELYFIQVMEEHGREHGVELSAFQREFQQLSTEMVPHLQTEETTVFPAFLAPEPPADLADVCRKREAEHLSIRRKLRRMAAMTCHYRIPPYACAAVEALFEELRELDKMLSEHIFLQNNVLFPRA